MKIIQSITISELKKPLRLNTYCETNVDYFESRKSVKKAISKGAVLLNDQVQHGGTWLKQGDIITILDLEDTPPKTYNLHIDVIYEDDHIAIVNKPPGLKVSGNQFKTLVNALSFNLKSSGQFNALPWPLPVHRLDSQTSGLMIIAKTKTSRIKLGDMFESHLIHKTYHAIAMGRLKEQVKKVSYFDKPINDKPSKSKFQVISETRSLKNEWLTFIKLNPETGRTHQLRIHLANAGTPILGDQLYSESTIRQKGLFLSATELSFKHPISEKPLHFSIQCPTKFEKRLLSEQRRWDKYHHVDL